MASSRTNCCSTSYLRERLGQLGKDNDRYSPLTGYGQTSASGTVSGSSLDCLNLIVQSISNAQQPAQPMAPQTSSQHALTAPHSPPAAGCGLPVVKHEHGSLVLSLECNDHHVGARRAHVQPHRAGQYEARKVSQAVEDRLLIDFRQRGSVHDHRTLHVVVGVVWTTAFVQRQVPVDPPVHAVLEVLQDVQDVRFGTLPRAKDGTMLLQWLIAERCLGVEDPLARVASGRLIQQGGRCHPVPVPVHSHPVQIAGRVGMTMVHQLEPPRKGVALVVTTEQFHVSSCRRCFHRRAEVLAHPMALIRCRPAEAHEVDEEEPDHPVQRLVTGRDGPEGQTGRPHQLQIAHVIVGPGPVVLGL
uniref:Uncharacterized protein n=1 Tax=Anopheles farauti TaxID=69004 RepID=A0A182Q449_9DIPT